jgi:hypothetical protein
MEPQPLDYGTKLQVNIPNIPTTGVQLNKEFSE